jgi:hypothetical protein
MLAYLGFNTLASVQSLRQEKQRIAGLVDRFDRRKTEAIEARTTAMAELGAEIAELKGI